MRPDGVGDFTKGLRQVCHALLTALVTGDVAYADFWIVRTAPALYTSRCRGVALSEECRPGVQRG
jgi:hypothetical protein